MMHVAGHVASTQAPVRFGANAKDFMKNLIVKALQPDGTIDRNQIEKDFRHKYPNYATPIQSVFSTGLTAAKIQTKVPKNVIIKYDPSLQIQSPSPAVRQAPTAQLTPSIQKPGSNNGLNTSVEPTTLPLVVSPPSVPKPKGPKGHGGNSTMKAVILEAVEQGGEISHPQILQTFQARTGGKLSDPPRHFSQALSALKKMEAVPQDLPVSGFTARGKRSTANTTIPIPLADPQPIPPPPPVHSLQAKFKELAPIAINALEDGQKTVPPEITVFIQTLAKGEIDRDPNVDISANVAARTVLPKLAEAALNGGPKAMFAMITRCAL
jgi:hypothetical protein